jgi:peptidoglycan/LPS O-acetylase OafA/YrhL
LGVAAALILAAAALHSLGFAGEEAWALAISYTALWAGAAGPGWLRHYNKLGDYSYGTYIYAWPVQQTFVALVPGIAPFQLLALSLPFVLLLACMSWHLVERPALGMKGLRLASVHLTAIRLLGK